MRFTLVDNNANDLPLQRTQPAMAGRTRRHFLRLAGSLAGLSLAGRARAGETPANAGLGDLTATGTAHPDLVSFDRLMTSFVTLHEAPGAALAVTRGGRLVYARGFGYADREQQQPVQPHSLFRIASVSKPITAAAVLQLAERGKLRLEDRVFEVLNFEPHLSKGGKVDPRLRDVTVWQLLHHTGGWDSARSPDPMVVGSVKIARALGVAPPARPEHIIRYMMGRPLDFAPGRRYAYSNFGYCLLGRVIEAVSGRSYEEYVRAEVLAPLGVRAMKIGKTLPEGRAAGEVKYYDEGGPTAPAVFGDRLGKPVPRPYGSWCLEAMDAHGGWIASAVDLVRFAAAFDPPGGKLLNAKSVRTMFARPGGDAGYKENGQPRADYYGCGWSVVPAEPGKANQFHAGGLDGSAALLVRRFDGLNWAVLFNAGAGPTGEQLATAIDGFVHHAADKVKRWPDVDLFAKYLRPGGE
jgi:N-acyl-D-amino-acid deacylase